MSLVQKFANAVRIKTGHDPLIVTTSVGSMECEIDSPLLSWILKKDTTTVETLPAYFTARATEGLRHPKLQKWDVNVNIDNGRFKESVLQGVTYDRMIAFMKARELAASRESGFSGTSAEIIAKRKPIVSSTNVLRHI